MGWTSKMRSGRLPGRFNENGEYKGKIYTELADIAIRKNENTVSSDTQNRQSILKEIRERVSQGEEIDIVVSEIAQREEVKKQFEYFQKNGITDLEPIFKSWYASYLKNKDISQRFNSL